MGRFNPREFKRFINTYTLQRKVSPHLEPTVMLALQAIYFRLDWLTVRSSLLAYRDAFMQALNQYTQDHLSQPLSGLMIDTAPPPASFLSFIRNGSPGHDFATLAADGESIDPYIFAGESSTGTDALRFLDALRQVGAVRQWLRGIAGRPESLQMITQNLKSEVMGAADQMSSDSRLIELMERLHGLANRLGGFPQPRHLTETPSPPDPEFADLNEEGRAAIAAWEAEVGELMQSLQQYYRTT